MDPQLRCDLDRDGISSIRHHASVRELLELYFAFHGKSALMAFFHGFHNNDGAGGLLGLMQLLAVIGADFGECPNSLKGSGFRLISRLM